MNQGKRLKALLIGVAWLAVAVPAAAVDRPNILFIMGDHGLYDKRFMYEESIRMPLVARWPGKIDAGTRVDRIVLNVDFAPTLLGLAGLSPPEVLQGRNFLPLLLGERPTDWRQAVYYRFYEEAYGVGPQEGIRTEDHKLVHFFYGDKTWEL